MSLYLLRAALTFAACLGAASPLARARGPATPLAPSPETVFVTYHVLPDKPDALVTILKAEQQWLRVKGFVVSDPTRYLLLRGESEAGVVCILELFTWTDASIPDHAPNELQAYWDEMNRLCPRVGQTPGIDFAEVEPVH